jgi:hypothetical protein
MPRQYSIPGRFWPTKRSSLKPSKPCARTIGCRGVADDGQVEVVAYYYLHRHTVIVSEDGIFIANDPSQVAYSWISGQGRICVRGLVRFHANSGGQPEQVSRFDFHGFKERHDYCLEVLSNYATPTKVSKAEISLLITLTSFDLSSALRTETRRSILLFFLCCSQPDRRWSIFHVGWT